MLRTYYNLAICLQKLEVVESKISYEKFISLKSDYTEAYNNLGIVLEIWVD